VLCAVTMEELEINVTGKTSVCACACACTQSAERHVGTACLSAPAYQPVCSHRDIDVCTL